MSTSLNPADHSDHDPSLCDYARIWLIQQYVAGLHLPIVEKLDNEQMVLIGFTTFSESQNSAFVPVFEKHGLTLDNLFEFSEYIRNYLLNERGLADEMGESLVPDISKISLN